MTGAEQIIEILKDEMVTRIFGYPGATVLEIYDALSRCDSIKHILSRHEQGAIHSASGYARENGRTAVVLATSGPGAANLITGIADCMLDSVPVVIITGQVETSVIGRDAFQEADIMGMTIPVTKHNYLIKKAEELIPSLREAFAIAGSGRPGPVLVDIAHDILSGEAVPGRRQPALPRSRANGYPLSEAAPATLEALEGAYRPLILAGGGVVSDRAGAKLCRFARKFGIPVAFTLMGRGILPEPEVNFLGMAGLYGTRAANDALAQCDLLIAVGTRFSDRTVGSFSRFSRTREVVHCDIDAAEINKNVPADIAAVCPAGDFFDALSASEPTEPERYTDWNAQISRLKTRSEPTLPTDRLSMREVLRAIDSAARRLSEPTIYVTDVGNSQTAAARELETLRERGFITSGGLGVMGFGLPAAIGASIAHAEENGSGCIALIAGDGGIQMTLQELSTLRLAPLPIKIFIFDNHALGMIKRLQDIRFEHRHSESELLGNPDFSLIAAAYGVSFRELDVNSRPELTEALEAILRTPEHMIITVRIR